MLEGIMKYCLTILWKKALLQKGLITNLMEGSQFQIGFILYMLMMETKDNMETSF